MEHLQYELMRLDMLLHRALRRMQQMRQQSEATPLDSFYVSTEKAYTLLKQPFGQGVEMAELDLAAYDEALNNITERTRNLLTEQKAEGLVSRLQYLNEQFGLDRFERDILLAAVAPALDTRYEQLFGYLHDDLSKKHPSVSLLLNLLCEPGPARLGKFSIFSNDGSLFKQKLLRRSAEWGPTLLNQSLHPDPGIVSWLLGDYQPHPDLEPHLTYIAEPQPDLLLLRPDQTEEIEQISQTSAVIAFTGKDYLCQIAGANLLAQYAGQPMLKLNLASAQAAGFTPFDILQMTLRDARLLRAMPLIIGWDTILVEDAPMPNLLELICRHEGFVVLSSVKAWQPRLVDRHRQLYWMTFDIPEYDQRHDLLNDLLNTIGYDDIEIDPNLNVTGLAGQFSLTTGQLRDVVNTAHDLAGQNGQLIDDKHLFAAARAHSNPRLATLARKITPRHGWEDLVLPLDQITLLKELLDTVKMRPTVLHDWGLGKRLTTSAGIAVLFTGPPGTGKTMAAEVLAGELGLDLYKINLSSVVSKYIGETEKNLEKIFHEAESSNAIIFFDEADAIFGKRSEVKDAHDRYANIEVSYLLQRMEDYDGVTILATNLRANLDDAFMRRLQFALDFPFPEIKDRLRIWNRLYPESLPSDPELDLNRMAENFRLAGGNIRNIIVSAAYLAAANGQVVKMEHLLHGARRELQKMGRLVDDEMYE